METSMIIKIGVTAATSAVTALATGGAACLNRKAANKAIAKDVVALDAADPDFDKKYKKILRKHNTICWAKNAVMGAGIATAGGVAGMYAEDCLLPMGEESTASATDTSTDAAFC